MRTDSISQNIARAIREPSGVLRWLKRKFADKPRNLVATKRNVASATLAERIAEIRAAGYGRIAVFSDSASFKACGSQLPNVEQVWISGDYDDIREGARTIHAVEPNSIEGVLLVGGDVATNYRQVVRWMDVKNILVPVYWVAQNFEYCGGAAPIAADCTDADVLIFNHFPDFFGQRDPLLVRVDVFDQQDREQKWFLVRPNESIRIRLSQWLPNRRGTACVLHHCAHPRLTLGRHYRWRSTAIYKWEESIAMAHSDTDFRPPYERASTEHKIGIGSMVGGKATITLPNYDGAIGPADAKAQALKYGEIVEIERETRFRIDETNFTHDGRKATFEDFFGVRFPGVGGSFWFSFDSGNAVRARSLAANHSVRGELEPRIKRPSTGEAARFVADLTGHDIMLDPHALPVEAPTSPVEFGFEFDMNFPVLCRFDVHAFDANGQYLCVRPFEKKEPGAVYADTIVDALDLDRTKVRLLMLSPDWIAVGADPRGRGAAGNLVVRLRRTGDYDATEFQNSWRNLGFTVGSLPHWLSQERMLAGRTNLLCGIVGEATDRVAIACVNASGRKGYATDAEIVVRVVAADGTQIEGRTSVGAFCYKLVWLDEVVSGWRANLAAGFGCLIVQSLDADLNASVVTIRADRAVALQHMWGY